MDDLTSGQIFILTNGARLLWALFALYAAVIFSRWLDKRIGHRFSESFSKMSGSRVALSLYLGARWLGICLVVAAVFS